MPEPRRGAAWAGAMPQNGGLRNGAMPQNGAQLPEAVKKSTKKKTNTLPGRKRRPGATQNRGLSQINGMKTVIMESNWFPQIYGTRKDSHGILVGFDYSAELCFQFQLPFLEEKQIIQRDTSKSLFNILLNKQTRYE